MLSNLLEVSATLATAPPPPQLLATAPAPPVPSNVLSAGGGCARCRRSPRLVKEGYVDAPAPAAAPAPPPAVWQSADDDLLFADDEFQTGVDAPPPAPYADPLSAPGATAWSGSVNAIASAQAAAGVTTPTDFRGAVGAQALGTPTSFLGGQTSPPWQPIVANAATTTTSESLSMKGMTSLQLLGLATAACTAILLVFFIVGMNTRSAPAAGMDPLAGL